MCGTVVGQNGRGKTVMVKNGLNAISARNGVTNLVGQRTLMSAATVVSNVKEI